MKKGGISSLLTLAQMNHHKLPVKVASQQQIPLLSRNELECILLLVNTPFDFAKEHFVFLSLMLHLATRTNADKYTLGK